MDWKDEITAGTALCDELQSVFTRGKLLIGPIKYVRANYINDKD